MSILKTCLFVLLLNSVLARAYEPKDIIEAAQRTKVHFLNLLFKGDVQSESEKMLKAAMVYHSNIIDIEPLNVLALLDTLSKNRLSPLDDNIEVRIFQTCTFGKVQKDLISCLPAENSIGYNDQSVYPINVNLFTANSFVVQYNENEIQISLKIKNQNKIVPFYSYKIDNEGYLIIRNGQNTKTVTLKINDPSYLEMRELGNVTVSFNRDTIIFGYPKMSFKKNGDRFELTSFSKDAILANNTVTIGVTAVEFNNGQIIRRFLGASRPVQTVFQTISNEQSDVLGYNKLIKWEPTDPDSRYVNKYLSRCITLKSNKILCPLNGGNFGVGTLEYRNGDFKAISTEDTSNTSSYIYSALN